MKDLLTPMELEGMKDALLVAEDGSMNRVGPVDHSITEKEVGMYMDAYNALENFLKKKDENSFYIFRK